MIKTIVSVEIVDEISSVTASVAATIFNTVDLFGTELMCLI